ncbi:MAG: transposase, partial [Acidobacteriia bacterium]|nr:transposase [Terriglobia bacterium]
LEDVLADQPQDKEIHVVLDNYSPHKGNEDWLAKFEGRVQFHFTPTSASWLNQIEIVFSLLQRKTLNGSSSKPKISCARPLKPSSENTTSTPNRSAGENARSRAVNFKIQLLIYAIKY